MKKENMKVAKNIVLSVLSENSNITGGEIWKKIKEIFEDEDQDCRLVLSALQSEGRVISEPRPKTALSQWSAIKC